jgi:hypothetical protein
MQGCASPMLVDRAMSYDRCQRLNDHLTCHRSAKSGIMFGRRAGVVGLANAESREGGNRRGRREAPGAELAREQQR